MALMQKRALRTAIYGWARMQPEPLAEPKPRFTFTLNGITPDELPMANSVFVELEGSGSEVFPTLVRHAPAAAAVRGVLVACAVHATAATSLPGRMCMWLLPRCVLYPQRGGLLL